MRRQATCVLAAVILRGLATKNLGLGTSAPPLRMSVACRFLTLPRPLEPVLSCVEQAPPS